MSKRRSTRKQKATPALSSLLDGEGFDTGITVIRQDSTYIIPKEHLAEGEYDKYFGHLDSAQESNQKSSEVDEHASCSAKYMKGINLALDRHYHELELKGTVENIFKFHNSYNATRYATQVSYFGIGLTREDLLELKQ